MYNEKLLMLIIYMQVLNGWLVKILSFRSNVARNIVKEVLENLLVIILDFFFFQKRMLKMYILDTNVHARVLLESVV